MRGEIAVTTALVMHAYAASHTHLREDSVDQESACWYLAVGETNLDQRVSRCLECVDTWGVLAHWTE